jgi:ABC-type nitrate/sulfonate/bicarbonate transport system permease component
MKPRYLKRLLPWIGVLLPLLIWQAITLTHWVNPVLLPSPIATLQTFVQILFQPEKSLAMDGLKTFGRTSLAFVIASSFGVPLGIMLGSSVPLYRSVEFLIDFCRSLPASTLIPVFLLFLGLNEANKIVGAAFSAGVTIVFHSAYGVMQANPARIRAAQVMGANRWQIIKDVLIWESLPQTLIGLRSGISLALVFVVVAEMLTGTEIGLGQRIVSAQQVLNVKDLNATILLTGLLGYGLNMGCLSLSRRLIHWRGQGSID